MSMSEHWPARDDELRRLYRAEPKLSINEIGRRMHIRSVTIVQRCRVLFRDNPRDGKVACWPERDDELSALYRQTEPQLSQAEIASKMNLGVGMVGRRCIKLFGDNPRVSQFNRQPNVFQGTKESDRDATNFELELARRRIAAAKIRAAEQAWRLDSNRTLPPLPSLQEPVYQSGY